MNGYNDFDIDCISGLVQSNFYVPREKSLGFFAYSEDSDRDNVLTLVCKSPKSCQYGSENQLQYDTKVVENCGGIVLVLGLATIGNGIFQQSFRV